MATPAPSLSPDLLKRITYSKYLLRRATALQKEGNELAAAQAVLVAHDAAEMLMRVVVDRIGANPKPRWNFPDFWRIVGDKTGNVPPLRGDMDRFNELRKGFKHKGNLPNPAVVGDLLPVVTAFCHEIASLHLKLEFETVSMADLIPNEQARAKVKEAERALEQKNLPDAILALGLAFDTLNAEAQQRHKAKLIPSGRHNIWHDSDIHPEGTARQLANTLRLPKLANSLRSVIDAVNMILLGIDPAKFRRFSDITPVRWYSGDGKLHCVWRTEDSLSNEQYEFCYDFVIDFGLRLAAE